MFKQRLKPIIISPEGAMVLMKELIWKKIPIFNRPKIIFGITLYSLLMLCHQDSPVPTLSSLTLILQFYKILDGLQVLIILKPKLIRLIKIWDVTIGKILVTVSQLIVWNTIMIMPIL